MEKSITTSSGKQISIDGLTPKKSLTEILKGTKQSERLDKVLIVILDRSGSMMNSMESGTKISVAWSILQKQLMPNMTGWAYGLLTFGGWMEAHWKIYPCKDTNALLALQNPRAEGGTPLRRALETAWDWSKLNVQQARFILLSDGCPTDASTNDILTLAKERTNIPIDTVGIGFKSYDYDPVFLRCLSEITGGVFTEIGSVKQLTDTILRLSPTNRPLLGTVKNNVP